MGMAASQARFLQLTARKTNIEYMGQQINQQRLALANQSAGLFEKMLTLEPPVPPSSLDDKYYTPGYTFTDTADDTPKKIISAPAAYTGGSQTITISLVDTDGTTNGADLTGDTFTFDLDDLDSDETNVIAAGSSVNGRAITADQDVYDLLVGTGEEVNESTETMLFRNVTIEHSVYDPDGNYQTIQETVPAILQYDNLQRLTGFTILDPGSTIEVTDAFVGASNSVNSLATLATSTTRVSGDLSGSSITDYDSNRAFGGDDLTYSGEFDEDTYNDDMNQYEFQKAAYDYQIERINLETAQIQKQDKSLELKMKQLDTEHKAIQTEMDAVQKVLQKNIESTFKTFG